ncbi:MAG: GNAT family N-acetyltransferase [Nitrospirota bacterium]
MIAKIKWDSEFFKRKIGKLTGVSPEKKLKKLIQQAHKDGYKYLTCRLIIGKMAEIQILEEHGFYITDIGVTWERYIDQIVEPTIMVREATIKDAIMLKSISKGLFSDSRFYNDPFFTYEEAERFYQTWVENSLRSKATRTFVVEGSGFITCKKSPKNKGDISLIGVIPEAQHKGIGRNLIYKALGWFKNVGVNTVAVRTQANNINAMNFYRGLGFRVKYVDVTMGLILNREG